MKLLFEKKTTSTGKLTLEKYVAVFKLRKTFFSCLLLSFIEIMLTYNIYKFKEYHVMI